MAADLGSIIAHLQLDVSNFQSSLDSAQSQVQQSAQNMSGGFESAGRTLQTVGAGITAAVTVPVVAFGKSAVEATQTFNASMSKTGALMGATQQEMNQLRDAAKEYGASTQFSATQCSDALGYMALAGWDANQSVSALPGVLNMAAASGMDLAQASDLVTDYLSAFGMEASQAGEMADVLSYAQAHSNTTTEALGEAFKNCAANAHAAGMDVQTTTALLGQLANQGLKGSEAGTALTAIMRDMTAKMKDGAIQIGNTKVQVQDANGNYRDMIDILGDVESATHGMGDAQRATALQSTFTSDSIKGLNLLLNAGTGSAKDFRDQLKNCGGTAEEMADKMNDNLEGDIKACQSAFESMQLAVGEKLDPVLRAFTQTLTKLFAAIGSLPAPVLQVMMVLISILAVVGPIILVMGTVMTKMREVRQGLRDLRTALNIIRNANIFSRGMSLVRTALGTIRGVIMNNVIPAFQSLWGIMLANPIAVAVVAIIALVAGFTYLWNHCEAFRAFWIKLWKDFLMAVKSFSPALAGVFQGIGNVISGFVNIIQALLGGIKDIVVDIFTGNFDKIPEDLASMGEKLQNAFGKIFDGLKLIAQNSLQALKDLFMAGLNTLFDPIINWGYSISGALGDAMTDLYGVFEDSFNLIFDYLGDLGSIIGDLLTGNFEGALQGVQDLFTHLGDNLKLVFQDIQNVIQELWTFISTSVSTWFNNVLSKVQQGAINILNTVTTFLSELPGKIAYALGFILGTIINWNIQVYSTLFSWGQQIVEAVVSWFQTLPDRLSTWLTNTLTNIQNWATNTKQQATQMGQEFIQNVITWFQTLPTRLNTWLQQTLNHIQTWASQTKAKAVRAGSNMVNGFISFVRNLPSRLWGLCTQALAKVTSFASQMKSKASSAARGFVTNIVNGVKSLPGKLLSIGRQAIQGLINGLKSGAGALLSAAKGLANQALNGMKAALHIKSPSRRFRDEVGKMIPAGVAVGVRMNAKAAYDTLRTFSDNLVELAPTARIAADVQTATGGINSTAIVNTTRTEAAIRELTQLVRSRNNAIDYDKMADAFTQGASRVDNQIVMDKEVVGKKVSEPVRTTNELVKARLDRLEGV